MEDITKNVRYFLSVVKKATGNERDLEAEAKGSVKPSKKPFIHVAFTPFDAFYSLANALTRVILSSRQGPGIQILDA